MKIYADDKYVKHLEKRVRSITVKQKLNIVSVENATMAVDVKTTAFGVFDKNGDFVKASLQTRGKNGQYIPNIRNLDEKSIPYIDCDAMFLGNVYPHFGHFMVEHLNRTWGVVHARTDGMKFVFIDNKNIGAQQFLYDFMALLGIGADDIIILNQSMRFRRVVIPEQGLGVSGQFYAPVVLDGYLAMADGAHADTVYDKVYFSRNKLPEHMRTLGEDKIQRIFEKNGFKVLYPETMTIEQQVTAVKNCSVLAGCAGTVLHWSLFMKPGGKVIQIKRNSLPMDSAAFQYQLTQISGHKAVFVSGSVENFKSQHGGRHAPQIIAGTKYLKQFFDDNGFEYTDDDLTVDAETWERYQQLVGEYKAHNGGAFYERHVKKFLIKIVALFVPTRVARGRVRKWLKAHL